AIELAPQAPVSALPPPPNQIPIVTLTAPATNAAFTEPASITVAASASDPDGTIAQVQFFQGSTLINTDTSAPYTFIWNSVPAGSYPLTARATDNKGAVSTSAIVNVTVNAAPPPPPNL